MYFNINVFVMMVVYKGHFMKKRLTDCSVFNLFQSLLPFTWPFVYVSHIIEIQTL